MSERGGSELVRQGETEEEQREGGCAGGIEPSCGRGGGGRQTGWEDQRIKESAEGV